jgi:NAD(P)-dependent dehydrogenase (short-subunit alcohol dehydrogenase family)
MHIFGKIIVVTGAAQGIGRGLCERFAHDGAAKVIAADLQAEGAHETALAVGGAGYACDVSKPEAVADLVERVEREHGPIDLFCSNAGVLDVDPDFDNAASASDAAWARSWGVNVMAHVYAARALLPRMIARGHGYFLNTVSAAGLLTQIGSGPYSTTKHAAIGFAEHLAITHRDHGIKVSVLCPQGVQTPMIEGAGELQPALRDGVLTTAQVAQVVVEGLAAERFLILPHAMVGDYIQKKTADYDRWLGGLAKMRRALKAH